MALTPQDVDRIAHLARLNLNSDEKAMALDDLNKFFALVEAMQSVDTDGIEPMAHPHELAMRLREDHVTQSDQAAKYQACAPLVRDRLYIVPQVIEG